MQRATFAVLLLLTVTVTYARKRYYDLNDAPALFEKFIKDYNRHYKSVAEREARYQIFVDNLKNVNEMNGDSDEPVFGITQFSDYTKEEFMRLSGYVSKKNLPIRD